MDAIIATLKLRDADEQFSCSPYQSDVERIDKAIQSLLPSEGGDQAWEILQSHLDRAWQSSDERLAREVGLVFGRLLKQEIPSMEWSVKVDEWGSALALDLCDSGISIFPEDIILKRFDRKEDVDLRQLSQGTLDMIERMFRQYHGQESE
jgi:Domain of unknown function (DUF3806)